MPNVSFVIDQLSGIGENLIDLNNLITFVSSECSRKIREAQKLVVIAVNGLQVQQVADVHRGESEGIPERFFEQAELDELHALGTSRNCLISSWRGIEAKRRLILDRARGRMSDEIQREIDRQAEEGRAGQ